jgi:DNA-binding NtrC family response regulator
MNFEKILIVDDDLCGRRVLESYLVAQQFSVTTVGTLAEADLLLKQDFFDLLLLDLDLPDGDGASLLSRIPGMESRPVVLIQSGNGHSDDILRCLRAGAFDFLVKPFPIVAIKTAMERAASFRHGQQVRRYLEDQGGHGGELVGDSSGIRHLRSLVERVAPTDLPVLIAGEQGTQKCRLAAMVHRVSSRSAGALVEVHCAGIDESRLENDLFGRITETCEEGSGRLVLQGGRLELALGGTLLLDEISELPMGLQLKLCGVLQKREWVRSGGERPLQLDFRLIATTQRDLAGCVARGTFLPELHQLLNGAVLHLPPLRERIADLPMLVCDWMERNRGTARVAGISDEALRHLMAYGWPGNVQELENVLERASLLGGGEGRIEAEAFQGLNESRTGAASRNPGLRSQPEAARLPEPRFGSEPRNEPLLTLEELEKRQVLRALEITNQNRTRAASLLKISVRTLRNKLHQYRTEDPTLVLTLTRQRHLPLVPPILKPQRNLTGRL